MVVRLLRLDPVRVLRRRVSDAIIAVGAGSACAQCVGSTVLIEWAGLALVIFRSVGVLAILALSRVDSAELVAVMATQARLAIGKGLHVAVLALLAIVAEGLSSQLLEGAREAGNLSRVA